MQNARNEKQTARLSVDKLYINGKRYYENASTVSDLGSLFDECLDPNSAKMDKSDIMMGGQQTIKGSIFLGFSAQVTNLVQVRNVIDCLRSDHNIAKAQHLSYAYIMTDETNKSMESYSDDGEHSAGKELFSLLKTFSKTNAKIVCVIWPG